MSIDTQEIALEMKWCAGGRRFAAILAFFLSIIIWPRIAFINFLHFSSFGTFSKNLRKSREKNRIHNHNISSLFSIHFTILLLLLLKPFLPKNPFEILGIYWNHFLIHLSKESSRNERLKPSWRERPRRSAVQGRDFPSAGDLISGFFRRWPLTSHSVQSS